MLHQDIVPAAIESYKQTIGEAIDAATGLTLRHLFALDIGTAHIDKAWIKKSLARLRTGGRAEDKRKCVIYVFSLASDSANEAILTSLLGHKQSRKEQKKKNNLCTVNKEFADSTTLYVGRSFTPRSRIAQHLGESNHGTYAMHLQQWAISLALSVRLDVYDVPAYRDNVVLERAMNVLETGLWDHLRPLLGRRGDK